MIFTSHFLNRCGLGWYSTFGKGINMVDKTALEKRIKGKGIRYYNAISSEGICYSIDLLRIKCKLTKSFIVQLRENAYSFRMTSRTLNFKEHHCFDNTDVIIYEASYGENEGYMRVEIRNKSKSNSRCCSIEVNPNKCFHFHECVRDIKMFLEGSEEFFVDSMDIAMDYPVDMCDLVIEKDRRSRTKYCRRCDNETIYFGKRGKVGNVKIYNKREESGLSYDLTRCELRVGNPLAESFLDVTVSHLPKVYVFSPTPQFITVKSFPKLS